jgi:CheY-like chemotaxis protein
MRQESDTEDPKMLGEGSSMQSRFPGQLSGTDTTPRMLGQGSAVPHSSDGQDPATPGQPELPPAAKKPRILIVDDDEGIKRVIEKALKMLPLETEIVTAADGIEALEKIEQQPVDLVIVDVMMPRMDGLGVCRRLREDIRTAFVPVMMLTASADESIRTKGYLVGTDDYVSKPFSTSDLNARVMRLLRRTYGL